MNDIKEKLIEHNLACLKKYQGVNDSIYYEGLAKRIIDMYSIKNPEFIKPREKLGIKVLAVFDDHGFIRRSDLEKGIQAKPDFVVFGGDHSRYTVELVAQAATGIRKYALRGNHDNDYIEQTFKRVGAVNIHGKILETSEGLVIGGMQGSHIYRENRKGRTFLTHYESMQVAKSMIYELKNRQTGMNILFSHDKAFTKTYDPTFVYNDGCSHVGLIGNTWLVSYNDYRKGVLPTGCFIHGHLHQKDKKEWNSAQIERNVYGLLLVEM